MTRIPLALALVAIGCHDFTITHRAETDGPFEADIDIGITVDDGHPELAEGEAGLLGVAMQVMFDSTVDGTISVPTSLEVLAATGLEAWTVTRSGPELCVGSWDPDLEICWDLPLGTGPITAKIHEYDVDGSLSTTWLATLDTVGNAVTILEEGATYGDGDLLYDTVDGTTVKVDANVTMDPIDLLIAIGMDTQPKEEQQTCNDAEEAGNTAAEIGCAASGVVVGLLGGGFFGGIVEYKGCTDFLKTPCIPQSD